MSNKQSYMWPPRSTKPCYTTDLQKMISLFCSHLAMSLFIKGYNLKCLASWRSVRWVWVERVSGVGHAF